jgi:hypothetical protein
MIAMMASKIKFSKMIIINNRIPITTLNRVSNSIVKPG